MLFRSVSVFLGLGHPNEVLGHPEVQALVHLAGWSAARVIAQLHPERLPWAGGEVVADESQQAGEMGREHRAESVWPLTCYLDMTIKLLTSLLHSDGA